MYAIYLFNLEIFVFSTINVQNSYINLLFCKNKNIYDNTCITLSYLIILFYIILIVKKIRDNVISS